MKMMLSIRNDGKQLFGNEKQLEIDLNLEHNLLILRNLGIYRNRQYEIVVTDDDQSVGIAAIEEEVQILR